MHSFPPLALMLLPFSSFPFQAILELRESKDCLICLGYTSHHLVFPSQVPLYSSLLK